MKKLSLLIVLNTLSAYATAATPEIVAPFIIGFIIILSLFFWGIHKAIKTQKTVYTLAMLPFVVLLFVMFFI